jgi:hypothetical protein
LFSECKCLRFVPKPQPKDSQEVVVGGALRSEVSS